MKHAHYIVAAMLGLFLFGCIASPPSYRATPQLSQFFSGWQVIAMFGAMISLMLVAIGYMISSIFQDEMLKTRVKSEFSQVIFSVIIILFAGILIGVAETTIKTVTQMDPQAAIICDPANSGGAPCHIALSRNYLTIIFETAKAANLRLLMLYSFISTVSSGGIEYRVLIDPVPMFNFSPFAGGAMGAEMIGIIFDMQIKLMMFTRFQTLLLDMIYQSIFPILLFTGIILRTFFFTRKLGGLLMAIALSIYLVLPMMYTFAGYILFASSGSTSNALLFNMNFDPSRLPVVGEESGVDVYDVNSVNAKKIDIGRCADQSSIFVFSSRSAMVGGVQGPVTTGTLSALSPNDVLFDRDLKPRLAITTIKEREIDPARGLVAINVTSAAGYDYTIRSGESNGDYLLGVYQKNEPASTLSVLTNLWQSLTWFFRYEKYSVLEASATGDELLGFNGIIDNTARLMLFTLFMPFVSLMVTIASIKVASPLFGGDAEIAGLTRLI